MRNKYRFKMLLGVVLVLFAMSIFWMMAQSLNTQDIDPVRVEDPKEELPGKEDDEDLSLQPIPIFTGDIDTYAKKEIEKIEVVKTLTIKEKLEVIAHSLSEEYFDNLPIEILNIELVQDKKIALINLKEQTNSETSKEWMKYLNAGSTGSTITFVTLTESFLQRDLLGEWIDGIEILYEGQAMEELDHFPATQIIYR